MSRYRFRGIFLLSIALMFSGCSLALRGSPDWQDGDYSEQEAAFLALECNRGAAALPIVLDVVTGVFLSYYMGWSAETHTAFGAPHLLSAGYGAKKNADCNAFREKVLADLERNRLQR